jgi:hypothetical protein
VCVCCKPNIGITVAVGVSISGSLAIDKFAAFVPPEIVQASGSGDVLEISLLESEIKDKKSS